MNTIIYTKKETLEINLKSLFKIEPGNDAAALAELLRSLEMEYFEMLG